MYFISDVLLQLQNFNKIEKKAIPRTLVFSIPLTGDFDLKVGNVGYDVILLIIISLQMHIGL
jgi:hypothetical protein